MAAEDQARNLVNFPISDFPSLKEAHGDLENDRALLMVSEIGVGVEETQTLKCGNSELSMLGFSRNAEKHHQKNIKTGVTGEISNPKRMDWRANFVQPRAASQLQMKFTPPSIVNGKTLVAVNSDCFSEGIKECEELVVGFFVGERLSFAAVQEAVKKLSKFNKEVSIKLHGDCAFIFKFNDIDDRKKVLEIGSFYIAKKLFILRPWSLLLEKSASDIKSVPIWVLIFGVPLHMWNNNGLSLIASYLGKPILADDYTLNQDRLAYARICIEIDTSFSYPASIPLLIDGKISLDLAVEYQWKPPLCSNCLVFGHAIKKCARAGKDSWIPKKTIVTQAETCSRVETGYVANGKEGVTDMGDINGPARLKTVQMQRVGGKLAEGANSELVGTGSLSKEGAKPVVLANSRISSAGEGDKDAVLCKGENAQKHELIRSKDPGKVGAEGPGKATKRDGPVHQAVGENSSSAPNVHAAVASTIVQVEKMHKLQGAAVESGFVSKQLHAEKDGDWTEVKGNRSTKKASPKKGNVFMVYSDFKSESRFPIDRKKEDEEFEKKFKYLSEEQKSEKRQEREMRRLKMYIPGASVSGSDSPGRGLRSQSKRHN